MKIAFVVLTDFPERTAPARRVHMMAKGLASRGHEVHVVVPQRFTPGPLQQVYDGLHVHWCSVSDDRALTRLSLRLAAKLALLREIDQLIRNGLDWLVTYNLGLDAAPMLMRTHQRGSKVAAMYDDLRAYPKQPNVEDRIRRVWLEAADHWLPQRAHLNILISTFLEQRVRNIAPQTPTIIIPPLVDLDRFQLSPAEAATFRKRWNLDDSVLISYLGSYWHVDGVAVLLRTVALLIDQGLRFRVSISGAPVKGLDCDDVPTLVRSLGLDQVVVQTGWLPTQEVIAAMSASDILVIPKLNDIANVAGVPTKLAEYLAVGRPVVASKIGDIPRYLIDGHNALLCEPGDIYSLADRLTQLISDASLRHKLAAEACQTASKFFDYRAAGLQVEAAMQQVRS